MLYISLPLGPRHSTAADASAFFGGLLPEGRALVNLAAQARCGTADLYEMLEYAGMDVAGALQVGSKAGSDAGSGLTRWTAHPPRTSSSRSRKNLLPCSMLKHIAWKLAAAAG
ncbi:HipA N-terminal domain-containing protein [Arthrobacter sp. PAMC 25486]|uniref:HipA N-terminal domain-containing protein n=1 Tax=Arthrobacter sp. PAMC 25486 TaxID=1494608 RepID=UPI00068FC151|nr:HipA N-terminal domain-containing protein [Arthrobacter sp. PAMC 25486]